MQFGAKQPRSLSQVWKNPDAGFFLVFYVFGELKKKKHKYFCLSCAWFYPKLGFFLCVLASSLSSEGIIKNTYLHIISNCDYFID